MRRILFVDDEPNILEGLQRMLRPQRHQWQMAFANGGEAALTIMEAEPFDIIVSDMRMPGMDGAALLSCVRERFPDVVRIVLSGQSDLRTALRAVPVAHQFLAKPCDPDRLRVAVERACNLKAVLTSELVRRTVGAIGVLPSLPRAYAALTQALGDPNASLDRIARLVEQDVGTSAKVLQLVNSAFFGLMNDIATVRTAVAYLGTDILQQLVLAIEVFRSFQPGRAIQGFALEELQSHAYLAARIAALLPAPKYLSEATVVAALLHDVGKLVLAAKLPDYLARVLSVASRDGRPAHAVEEELNGVTHAEIGAYLLGLWGLPSPIVEAVAHHHAPARVPRQGFDSIAAVHVADVLAHEHAPAPQRGASPAHPTLDLAYLEALGVSGQLPAWRQMAEETARALKEG